MFYGYGKKHKFIQIYYYYTIQYNDRSEGYVHDDDDDNDDNGNNNSSNNILYIM